MLPTDLQTVPDLNGSAVLNVSRDVWHQSIGINRDVGVQ